MKLRGLYRLAFVVAAGGMVFQTTTSCVDQTLGTLGTTLVPSLTSALETQITNSLQGDTTSSSSISPPTDGPFAAVTAAIQGLRSNLGTGGTQGSGSSSSSGSQSTTNSSGMGQ